VKYCNQEHIKRLSSGSVHKKMFSKTANNSARASSSKQHQHQRETSCLFCHDFVSLPLSNTPEYQKKFQKLIVNLCTHMGIPDSEISLGEVSAERYPFCSSCEGLVFELWKLQSKLDQFKVQIENAVKNGEILRTGPNQPGSSGLAMMENLKFSRLPELILEGRYRSCTQH